MTTNLMGEVRVNPLPLFQRGRDYTRLLSPPVAGRATLTLDNREGQTGPETGIVKGRLLRINEGGGFDGLNTGAGLWSGYIESAQSYRRNFDSVTRLTALGPLAYLLSGKRQVATRLHQGIRSDEALSALLDVVGFPRNAGPYLDGLRNIPGSYPVGQLGPGGAVSQVSGVCGGWNLASTAGDDPDTSGNGNDATLVGGTRGQAAIDDDGTLSYAITGSSYAQVASASEIDNIFDFYGAMLFIEFICDSDGASNTGQLFTKGYWNVGVSDESSGAVKLRVVIDTRTYVSVDRIITLGDRYALVVFGVLFPRVFHLLNLDTGEYTMIRTLTGSEMTQVAGSGPPTSLVLVDEGDDLYIGYGFDGRISVARMLRNVSDALSVGGSETDNPFSIPTNALAKAHTCARVFDVGYSIFNYWWLGDAGNLLIDPWDEGLRIVASEGPGAQLYEDKRGRLVFKNRLSLGVDERSASVQYAISDAAQPSHSDTEGIDDGLDLAVQYAQTVVNTREAGDTEEVWAAPGDITLPGTSGVVVVRAAIDDPVVDAIVPVEDTDFTITDPNYTVTLERDSGGVILIKFAYSGGEKTVSGLVLRAKRVSKIGTTLVATQGFDPDNPLNQEKVIQFDRTIHPEIDLDDAQAIMDALPLWYADGNPTIRDVLILGDRFDKTELQLGIELGDRFSLTDANLGLDGDEFILLERKDELDSFGRLMRTRLTGERVRDVAGIWAAVSG